MSTRVFLSENSRQTKKIGQDLAKSILENRQGEILGLVGELGAGKTNFIKGIAKGLAIDSTIISPTFVIMKKFNIPYKDFDFFYHIDCYRIASPEEMKDLGFKEIVSNSRNIVCIEWANNIKSLLPKNSWVINFSVEGENKRRIKISN